MVTFNWDLLVGSPVFFCFFAVSSVSTFAIYFKTSFSDPGTVKTQIYINQNTEDGGTIMLRHARKPSSVI
jgi:hypothetical protein